MTNFLEVLEVCNCAEECGGSVVECLTQDGGVAGSSLTRGKCLTGMALIRRLHNC